MNGRDLASYTVLLVSTVLVFVAGFIAGVDSKAPVAVEIAHSCTMYPTKACVKFGDRMICQTENKL